MLLQQIVLLIAICCDHLIIARSMQSLTTRKDNQMLTHTKSKWRLRAMDRNVKDGRPVRRELQQNTGEIQHVTKAIPRTLVSKTIIRRATGIVLEFLKKFRKSLPQRKHRYVRSTEPDVKKGLGKHLQENNLKHKAGNSSARIKVLSSDSPSILLPMYDIYADVGVGFQKYLSPELFVDKKDGNTRYLDVQLLTVDGKELFKTSWIKFDESKHQIYGFPLQGNQEKHSFLLKATNSRGKSRIQTFDVIVHSLPKIFNHYIEVCTTTTLAEYAGNVEQRLGLSKAIGKYIFPDIRVDDVWITRFADGCVTVVFRQLPARQKCDFKAIKTINQKLFENGEINAKFRQALNGVTVIKTANLTLLNECKNQNTTRENDDLGWLRDVAPIFILIAVVAVPTLISCIVCKEVRRRQALMRQIQDRRMKEDKEQMLIQAAEYKHECGLDSDSDEDTKGGSRPKKQQNEEEYKFFGFSKIADIIIPEVVIDTVKQGTELLTTLLPKDNSNANTNSAIQAAQRRVSVMASLNPRNKLLDLSQEEELRQKKLHKKKQNSDTKVKKMVRFMKNPLEIKQFNVEENATRVEQEKKKTTEEPSMAVSKNQGIGNMLPSIRSIINKLRLEHAETISSSFRNKFGLLLSSSSSFSSAATTQTSLSTNSQTTSTRTLEEIKEESLNDIKKYNEEGKILCRGDGQYYTASPVLLPRPGQTPIGYGLNIQAGIVPILGQNFGTSISPGPRKTNDTVTESEANPTKTIFDRILENGRRFLQGREEAKRHEDGMYGGSLGETDDTDSEIIQNALIYNLDQHAFDQGLRSASFEEYKQYLEKDKFLKLAESIDAENVEEQLCCLNYGINDNLKKDYFHTTHMLAATEIGEQRFAPRSDLSERHPCKHGFDENADFCFVNKTNQQLITQTYANHLSHSSSNECSEQLHRRVKDRNTNIDWELDDYITTRLDSYSDAEILQQEDAAVKLEGLITPGTGLKHYDPLTGNWYQSTPNLVEEADIMISDQFLNEDLYHQWNDEEEMQQSKLTWYDLNTEEGGYNHSCNQKQGRHRRKTGLGLRIERCYGEDIPSLNYQEEIRDTIIQRQQDTSDLLNSQSQYGYDGFSRHCNVDYGTERLMARKSDFSGRQECFNSSEEECCQYFDNQEQYRGNEDTNSYQEYQEMQHWQQEGMSGERFVNYEDFQYGRHHRDWSVQEFSYETEECLSEGQYRSRRSDSNRHEEHETFDFPQGYSPKTQSNCSVKSSHLRTCYEERQPSSEGSPTSGKDSRISSSASTLRVASQDSSHSDTESTDKSSLSSNSRRERRRSVLERQYRVEIPEQAASNNKPISSPGIQLNPMFVIEEGEHPDISDDRGNPDGDIDIMAANKPKPNKKKQLTIDDVRRPPYGDSFSNNEAEDEKMLQQDDVILSQQMRNYLKLNYPQRENEETQHFSRRRSEQFCGKRDELSGPSKRPGMRRFSTPSMESWTSTPEKYYYDATGENCISEEDIAREAIRNEKQKQSFTGRGRAREYTTRLLKGVSPKIRRHSTSVMGPGLSSSSGNFLGKIGEGKLVQTIQTKLGRKESRSEEPKSPKVREREKIDDDKNKGSPLNAIRNKLYLLSVGK